jgi:hypothetical protein
LSREDRRERWCRNFESEIRQTVAKSAESAERNCRTRVAREWRERRGERRGERGEDGKEDDNDNDNDNDNDERMAQQFDRPAAPSRN